MLWIFKTCTSLVYTDALFLLQFSFLQATHQTIKVLHSHNHSTQDKMKATSVIFIICSLVSTAFAAPITSDNGSNNDNPLIAKRRGDHQVGLALELEP